MSRLMEVDFEFLKQFGGYGVLVVIFWRILEKVVSQLIIIGKSTTEMVEKIEKIELSFTGSLTRLEERVTRIESFVATGSSRRRKSHDTDEIR